MVTKKGKNAKGAAEEDFSRRRPNFDTVPEDVKNEYIRMAPTIARITEKYSDALEASLRAKQDKEETYAAVYMEECKDAAKKPGEAYLKQAVLGSETYQAACKKYIDAEVAKSRIQGDLESLRVKKDMLVSLGAHVRIELGSNGGGTHDLEEPPADDESDDDDED